MFVSYKRAWAYRHRRHAGLLGLAFYALNIGVGSGSLLVERAGPSDCVWMVPGTVDPAL